MSNSLKNYEIAHFEQLTEFKRYTKLFFRVGVGN